MSIIRINSPISGKEMGQRFDQVINVINGYGSSFSTDELTAPVINGQDIITLTSDTTNSTGVVVITPNAFTYKDSNSNVKNVGFKEDIYDDIDDTHTLSFGGYGHLTSGGTALYTFIPLPYKIPTGATVDISSFSCTVRGAGGSVVISSLSDVTSIVATIRSEGAVLQLVLNSSTKFTSYTNNNAYVTYGGITYKVVADNG